MIYYVVYYPNFTIHLTVLYIYLSTWHGQQQIELIRLKSEIHAAGTHIVTVQNKNSILCVVIVLLNIKYY